MHVGPRVKTLQLTEGGQDAVERARFRVGKGRALAGIRLKLALTINKSDAGTSALTAAMKKTLLEKFGLSVRWGKAGKYRHILAAGSGGTLYRARQLQRFAAWAEVVGYSDTVDGLGKTIAASGDTTMECAVTLPTGFLMQSAAGRKLLAMGRSQARTLEIEVTRSSNAVISGTITLKSAATVTVDVFPVEVHSKYDLISPVPEYFEHRESSNEFVGPDGLPLLVTERTTTHAATTITKLDVKVDSEVIHEGNEPDDILDGYQDSPEYVADGDLSDTEVVAYQVPSEFDFPEWPSGRVYVRDVNQNLTPLLIGYYGVPILSEEFVKEMVGEVSKSVRNKPVLAVSLTVLPEAAKIGIPSRLQGLMPMAIVDQDDAEFEKYPGWLGEHLTGTVAPHVPKHIGAAAERAIAAADAGGASKAGDDIAKQVALAIPAAAQSGRGFAKSPTGLFAGIRKTLGR